jgi:hypothetical protein
MRPRFAKSKSRGGKTDMVHPRWSGSRRAVRTWWRSACGVGAVVLVALAVNAQPPAPQAPAAASPFDEPLRLIGTARQTYQGVRDYVCLFVKREQIKGVMQPENLISMKVRTQPFSVYLRWHSPKQFQGQEACYVHGRNNNQMRVRSPGLLGAVGFVSLDPRDPRAAENSRHTIVEAGIGNLIERFSSGYAMDRSLGNVQVRLGDYEYNRRRCTRIETIHPDNAGGRVAYYRSVIYLDKETHLPIRVENYDWPRQGGAPDGEQLEVYSYVDMKFNVGLSERDFNY